MYTTKPATTLDCGRHSRFIAELPHSAVAGSNREKPICHTGCKAGPESHGTRRSRPGCLSDAERAFNSGCQLRHSPLRMLGNRRLHSRPANGFALSLARRSRKSPRPRVRHNTCRERVSSLPTGASALNAKRRSLRLANRRYRNHSGAEAGMAEPGGAKREMRAGTLDQGREYRPHRQVRAVLKL